jgi:hypothetical protein
LGEILKLEQKQAANAAANASDQDKQEDDNKDDNMDLLPMLILIPGIGKDDALLGLAHDHFKSSFNVDVSFELKDEEAK